MLYLQKKNKFPFVCLRTPTFTFNSNTFINFNVREFYKSLCTSTYVCHGLVKALTLCTSTYVCHGLVKTLTLCTSTYVCHGLVKTLTLCTSTYVCHGLVKTLTLCTVHACHGLVKTLTLCTSTYVCHGLVKTLTLCTSIYVSHDINKFFHCNFYMKQCTCIYRYMCISIFFFFTVLNRSIPGFLVLHKYLPSITTYSMIHIQQICTVPVNNSVIHILGIIFWQTRKWHIRLTCVVDNWNMQLTSIFAGVQLHL